MPETEYLWNIMFIPSHTSSYPGAELDGMEAQGDISGHIQLINTKSFL